MNYEVLASKVESWIKQKNEEAKTNGVVIGISGGVDAAVCAGLVARALGPEKVTGVLIQTTGNKEEFVGGKLICEAFGIEPIVIDLQETYKSLMNALPSSTPVIEGGLRDRIRSATLYYIANLKNQIVVSTVNKNEYMLGYFCKNGSGMADIMPIADIYKSDIWNLGIHIGVPDEIIKKIPTGDFWPGQVDEDLIGVPYDEQDTILKSIESNGVVDETNDYYIKLLNMYNRSHHKRQLIQRCTIY